MMADFLDGIYCLSKFTCNSVLKLMIYFFFLRTAFENKRNANKAPQKCSDSDLKPMLLSYAKYFKNPNSCFINMLIAEDPVRAS